jgi:putative oxidoreductase
VSYASDIEKIREHSRRLNSAPDWRESTGGVIQSATRIAVSFLFLCHGMQKLFGLFGGLDGHGAMVPTGSWPLWWAGSIELIGGGLVLLGLLTRPAALVCSGEMAFAYFTSHQPRGPLPLQNHGELAALFCWTFLLIAALGPGAFALDTILRGRGGKPE